MKEILSFLNGLQKNNTREWMEANKSQYLNSNLQFEDIMSSLIDNIAAFDQDI